MTGAPAIRLSADDVGSICDAFEYLRSTDSSLTEPQVELHVKLRALETEDGFPEFDVSADEAQTAAETVAQTHAVLLSQWPAWKQDRFKDRLDELQRLAQRLRDAARS